MDLLIVDHAIEQPVPVVVVVVKVPEQPLSAFVVLVLVEPLPLSTTVTTLWRLWGLTTPCLHRI